MKKNNIVTMKQVAKLAEVSTTTVSHVINDTRSVSDKLRTRVLNSMKELDYQPNSVARSLRKKETQLLGLIVPNNINPFYADVTHGVESVSFQNGYSVILCNTNRNLEREILYTDLLLNKRVDGIMFVGVWDGIKTEHLKKVDQLGVPMVVVDRFTPGLRVDQVVTDNILGGWLATTHLISLGHKIIAFVGGLPEFTPNAQRVIGYKAALNEKFIHVDDKFILKSNFLIDGGFKAAQKLLSMNNRPTAIFASNDLMAIGIIRAAKDIGYLIPEDLSVVGFDGINITEYSVPRLTTVSQPMVDMGMKATEFLLERIRGFSGKPRTETYQPTLIIRGSTMPPKD